MDVHVTLHGDVHSVHISDVFDVRTLKSATASALSLNPDSFDLALTQGGDVLELSDGLADLRWDPDDAIHVVCGRKEWTQQELATHEGIVGRYNDNLVSAAERGRAGVVGLLADAGAAVTGVALERAAAMGHIDVVRYLLLHTTDTEHIGEMGPPLVAAAFDGHLEVVTILLDHGVKINARKPKGLRPDNWTAAMCAAYCGHVAVLAVLCQRNADLSLKDDFGRDALSLAALQGRESCLSLLLQQGAVCNLHIGSKEETPAMWAARRGHLGCLRALGEHGADLAAESKAKATALLFACQRGFTEVVTYLLSHNVPITGNIDSETALILAAKYDATGAIVEALLSRGACVKGRDHYGCTALHYACQNGRYKMAKSLLLGGAEVNAVDGSKQSALFSAARAGDCEIASLLIEHNIDQTLKDTAGATARQRAEIASQSAVMKLLDKV